MTVSEFCQVSRGEMLRVDGNGMCVVESSYIQVIDGKPEAYIDIRLQNGEVITGLSEDDAVVLESTKH